MMSRPAIETMEFVALDGGGTRVEHRIRAEERGGISFLLYRASMLAFRAGTAGCAVGAEDRHGRRRCDAPRRGRSEDRDEYEMKGVGEPIRVYQVRWREERS